MPAQPGSTVEPSTPLCRSIGAASAIPAPMTRERSTPASARTSNTSSAAVSSDSSGASSTSSSRKRSARTVDARSATATRTWRWPKSIPSAEPAAASSRRKTGGRPRPAGCGRSFACSTINPRVCRSATSEATVVRERPVVRARSLRLAVPARRSASTTRRRLSSRVVPNDSSSTVIVSASGNTFAGLRPNFTPTSREKRSNAWDKESACPERQDAPIFLETVRCCP